jgi:hypothetical protein
VARFDYNPLTNQLDLVDSPAGYINGVVADPTLLPVTLGTPALDSVYLAKAGSGLWLISRKPAGLYCRVANNGNAADWQFLGAFPEVNADGNWALYSSADPTKELKFSLSGITTGTTRTLTVPNKSGTIATTDASDLTSGTLADARLSSNVPLKDAANTFSANQTLNGTNNVAPNQTAASGSSIMTRDLGDARYGGQNFVAMVSGVTMTQNNTTLEDIAGASLVLPTGTYIITVKMFFIANASAGSKMAMAFDGTSSQRGFRQTITTSVVQAVAIGSFGSTSSATATETEHYRVYECVVTAQGTLKLQGAQNVAGINALTASGFLKAEKIV